MSFIMKQIYWPKSSSARPVAIVAVDLSVILRENAVLILGTCTK